ncbi:MAG: MgtC/SapB family protein, partial [Nitrospinota bacterium]
MFSDETETVLRLLIAIPLGGLIGFEREIQNQPAGLRTHIVLCVGSTLMMLVSIFVAKNIAHNQFSDPSRIAAQVVTGIGFLGAGAIMRLGVSVKGLTTAASLWTTAGIGLAIGSGFYLGALMTTFILLVALNILKKWPKIFADAKSSKTISVVARESTSIIG